MAVVPCLSPDIPSTSPHALTANTIMLLCCFKHLHGIPYAALIWKYLLQLSKLSRNLPHLPHQVQTIAFLMHNIFILGLKCPIVRPASVPLHSSFFLAVWTPLSLSPLPGEGLKEASFDPRVIVSFPCQPDSAQGHPRKNSQMRRYPDRIGLWVGLWGVVLIGNWL